MKSKKGISPLIATVLVIGFTVALAAIILTWGQTFTRGIQESTEMSTEIQLICAQDVNFAVNSVCTFEDEDVTKAKITIDNKGNIAINRFMARLYEDANTVDTAEISNEDGSPVVGAFGLRQPEVEVTLGELWKVELVPIIMVDEKEVTCSTTISSFGNFNDNLIGNC